VQIHGFLLAGWVGLALGCIGPNRPPSTALAADSPEHVAQRDYIVGEPKVARAGEAMVVVQDYWTQMQYQENVILDRQVTLATGHRVMVLPHGRALKAVGPIKLQGIQYIRYVDASDTDGTSAILYVRMDGTLADFLYERDGPGTEKGMAKIIGMAPSSFKLPVKASSGIPPGSQYLNFAILFNGEGEDAVHAECLAFSPDDLSHPSTRESLAIPLDQASFTCRNLRIRITGCTPAEIAFTVESD
jgi:hypothetical protein